MEMSNFIFNENRFQKAGVLQKILLPFTLDNENKKVTAVIDYSCSLIIINYEKHNSIVAYMGQSFPEWVK